MYLKKKHILELTKEKQYQLLSELCIARDRLCKEGFYKTQSFLNVCYDLSTLCQTMGVDIPISQFQEEQRRATKKAQKRRTFLKCRDSIKEYKIRVKDKEAQWRKNYRSRNRIKINAARRLRDKKNPKRMLVKRLHSRVKKLLKSAGVYKKRKTNELLGCTVEFFKKWITAQFKPGMSWDTQNSFHLDHYIPCAAFDLTDPEQQKICFNWSNYQPLYPLDNLQKSSKMPIPPDFSKYRRSDMVNKAI